VKSKYKDKIGGEFLFELQIRRVDARIRVVFAEDADAAKARETDSNRSCWPPVSLSPARLVALSGSQTSRLRSFVVARHWS
jgi:hypothetical protein